MELSGLSPGCILDGIICLLATAACRLSPSVGAFVELAAARDMDEIDERLFDLCSFFFTAWSSSSWKTIGSLLLFGSFS